MGIHISAGSVALAIGGDAADDGNIVLGPLHIWLGFNMQGIFYRGCFDFICEKADYRPEAVKWFATGEKWFETWKHSPEERGGYFLGRLWSLQTGSLVKRRSL